MADYRVQVVGTVLTSDPGRDYITNVLHYAAPTTTANAIGDAVKAAFCTISGAVYSNFHQVKVNVYNLANPLHSPPVYTTIYTGGGSISPGPRQVGLCLSFYSGLNIRGQRGRIYIGPWDKALMTEYASSSLLTSMMGLAAALKNPGGADVIHQIYHPKTASWSNVSNYFANNRWDTMRSRLPKETARQTLP